MGWYDVRERLYYLAERHEGYFTMREAREAGIPAAAVIASERRGGIERRTRGVYRFVQYPYGGHSHHWEAILWPQVRADIPAVLSHESALLLHHLSDVNPAETHITVPKEARLQRTRPKHLVVHHDNLKDTEIVYIDGLPVTSILRTLTDISRMAPNSAMLHDALRDAKARGLRIDPNFFPQAKKA